MESRMESEVYEPDFGRVKKSPDTALQVCGGASTRQK